MNKIGKLNDLWMFNGADWTWISGNNARNQVGVYGTKGIPSSSNIPGAREYPGMVIDSSNNIWIFGGHGLDNTTSQGNFQSFYLN